jgi:branched-chain amino acid transport system substrate-binding protein
MKKRLCSFVIVLLIVLLFCVTNFVFATEKVIKIGVLLPLTGKLAVDGACLKNGIDLAVEIINNKTDIDVLLGKTEGLPNLGGAKIELVYADDQAAPERGMSEAERLITSGEVVALFGSYTSSVTATAQMIAERYKFPMLNGLASSPMLNKKGLKWFFRTTPDDIVFMRSFFDFLKDYKQSTGKEYQTVAIIHEDSLWGTDCGRIVFDFAHEFGYKVVADISFPSGTVDLSSEVQRIKIANPDVLIEICFAQDQILLMRTMKFLDVNVDVLFSGVQYPDIFEALQEDAEGMIFRDSFSEDSAETNENAKKILDLWYEKYSVGMGNAPRGLNGLFVLADAINRAGTTDPESIRKALTETDIPKEKLFLPWSGVKFNSNGLNEKSNAVLVQYVDGKLHQIWPFESSAYEPVVPLKKWDDR